MENQSTKLDALPVKATLTEKEQKSTTEIQISVCRKESIQEKQPTKRKKSREKKKTKQNTTGCQK